MLWRALSIARAVPKKSSSLLFQHKPLLSKREPYGSPSRLQLDESSMTRTQTLTVDCWIADGKKDARI